MATNTSQRSNNHATQTSAAQRTSSSNTPVVAAHQQDHNFDGELSLSDLVVDRHNETSTQSSENSMQGSSLSLLQSSVEQLLASLPSDLQEELEQMRSDHGNRSRREITTSALERAWEIAVEVEGFLEQDDEEEE